MKEQEKQGKKNGQDQESAKRNEVKRENEKARDERVKETGQMTLNKNKNAVSIHLLTIIGEIEGHDVLPSSAKATKYEHILPQLAAIEDSEDIDGVLVMINTVGGDVSCGLALAEMIASLSKPTVSLVIGDSHSIGVPLAVSADYSFIVPTGTMLIHPVRMSGMVIGAPQTYQYFQKIQERITSFVANHSRTPQEKIERMMMNTKDLSKDLGTLLVGKDAVENGLLNEVGGVREAMKKLYEMIGEKKKKSERDL